MGAAPRWRARAVALLVLTVVVAALAARRGSDLSGGGAMVPADHPWVRLDREITAEFGFENPVVWVIAAREGTVWNPAHLRHVQEITGAALRIPGVVATDVISLASPNVRALEVTESGLQPTYLMAAVPSTPAALDALRRRVDADPNYRGNLVSLDGRAAMVVADFRRDADARVVAEAARALQAAHRDSRTDVHVAGTALLETMPLSVDRWTLNIAAVALLSAAVVLLSAFGPGAALICGLAAALAAVWTACAVAAAGLAQPPWTIYAVPYAAALAAAAAVVPLAQLSWRSRGTLAAALAGGFACMWLFLDSPMRAFATAGAAASLFGMLASGCWAPAESQRHALPATRATALLGTALGNARAWRLGATALVAAAMLGVPHLRTSLSLAGYGQRYMPGSEGRDLRAIAQYFPPPTALALRVRGAPGFVTSPAVLRAFDNVVVPLRADPAVVGALSVADLVKTVHRGFNDDDPAFATIPDDAGLVARYLTLAYSPAFRRFVDRALATAAIWIQVRTDAPAELDHVLARIRAQLAAQPVPDAEVDLIGGDGAWILVMAAMLRTLARAMAMWAAGTVALLALLCGWRTAFRGALGIVTAIIVMGGTCAWLAVPLDLVSVPILAATAAAAAGVAVLSERGDAVRWRALAVAVMLISAPGLLSTYMGTQLLGSTGLALGVIAAAFPASRRRAALTLASAAPVGAAAAQAATRARAP